MKNIPVTGIITSKSRGCFHFNLIVKIRKTDSSRLRPDILHTGHPLYPISSFSFPMTRSVLFRYSPRASEVNMLILCGLHKLGILGV